MILLFKQIPQINFLKYSKWFISISLFFVMITVVLLFWRGLKLGFDFRGGTEILLKFDQVPDKAELTNLLEQEFNTRVLILNTQGDSSGELLVSFTKSQTTSEIGDLNRVLTTSLDSAGYEYEIRKMNSIGPKIGVEIRENAWYSIIISLVLVLIYMAFRFNFQFGIGAIVAIFHDVFITIGAFALFNIEFDLTGLAGLLTLIGYSLNDSIVIFDRVRENIARHPGRPLYDLINISVNETLSRTILTVLTTFIIILTLYIWGGSSIRGFSFAFLVGILIGTYSSVFIASPVAIFIANRRQQTSTT